MTFRHDPAFVAEMMSVLARMGEIEQTGQLDALSLRESSRITLPFYGQMIPYPHDVSWTPVELTRDDGTTLHLRWYEKSGSQPGSAVVFAHGGGMILGSLDDYDAIVARYVAESGVPILAVEYRLAPEHPYPSGMDDCLAAVAWLAKQTSAHGVDPDRIGVMGDSGGGALAASVALASRDRGGPQVAKQILIYPMLDDRTREPDPEIAPLITVTWEINGIAWDSVLGVPPASEADPIAAPARVQDLHGLPSTYIDVGELDIFRAEDIDFAGRLLAAGVSTELHVYPGVPHAFDLVAPGIGVSRRALQNRYAAMQSF